MKTIAVAFTLLLAGCATAPVPVPPQKRVLSMGTRVVENTVGDPSYAQRASEDLGKIRFLPPTADCKAQPFFYTFTREF